MLNKVMIIGRLGQDPQEKALPSGAAVATFSVATDESYTDKQGAKQKKTEWHRVTAFGKLADICNQYLKKGALVYVEGKLSTRAWEDKSGAKHSVTEIIASQMKMLEFGKKADDGPPDPPVGDDVPF